MNKQHFNNLKVILFTFVCLCTIFTSCTNTTDVPDITPNSVVPTARQIAYQQMEFIGFIHFTVNTFTDREWGNGDEKPTVFNPTALDARQWAKVASEAGMKELILTAKHHDGFCLWQSEFTNHSVKSSPWKDGKGDVVKEFTDACREFGLMPGLYLSPWDRNHAEYGRPAYIDYYRNQLTELLTKFGDISEIWFDGANGGTGYYGGANEERRIDRKTYYQWDSTIALVKKLQPQVMIFSDAGPDVHWIGNEHGFAGETFWSTIKTDSIFIGDADVNYLNTGDPDGNKWIVGQCDVSIRPGWFFHSKEDTLVKTPQQLLDIYYKSVGRNAILLLNLPPDQRGLIHENDVAALKEFKSILDETFKTNLALNKKATASNYRLEHEKFSAPNILDNSDSSYWATDDGIKTAEIEIDLGDAVEFDRIMLQEPIRFGQRIEEFEIEYWDGKAWKSLAKATTIGYKRLLRVDAVTTNRIKIKILKSNNIPAISNFGVYKASERE